MTGEAVSPVLGGKKALLVGIANEHSIAYGCAKAFRQCGADLAITYLNAKAKTYVEPLATELNARGFARIEHGELIGRIFLHQGDDSEFRAIKA
jgi:enoyl-[acyl-carrier protein] reductase I